MKVVGLVSGGKDSCYAMMKCIEYGHEIVALANLMPADDSVDELDSYMYQTVGHQIIVSYAECMGMPLFRRRIKGSTRHQHLNYQMTPGDEVEDLYILLSEVKKQIPSINAVSSGAIASDYQRLRVENICSRLGLVSLAYLWKQDQSLLLREMITKDVAAIIVKVAAMGLTPTKHLGKNISDMESHLLQLKKLYGINVCGEGGEYETLTLDCPLFTNAQIVLDDFQLVLHSQDSIAQVGILHPLSFHLEHKKESHFTDTGMKDDLVSINSCYIHEAENDSLPEYFVRFQSLNTVTCLSEPTDGETQISRTNRDTYSLGCWIQNSSKNCEDLQKDLVAVLNRIESQLKEDGLDWENVLYIHLYIADMNDFSLANETYVKFITENKCHFGVPSRSTIELPLTQAGFGKAFVEVLVSSNTMKKVLHVQSISCWAPSCIGPYSQATMHKGILLMAGQLGLDPPTMVLCSGGAISELEQALKNCDAVAKNFNCNLLSSVILFVIYCSSSLNSSERIDIENWMKNYKGQEEKYDSLQKWEWLNPVFLYVLAPNLPKRAFVEVKPVLYIPNGEDAIVTTEIQNCTKMSDYWGFKHSEWHDSCFQKCIIHGKICIAVLSITTEVISKLCEDLKPAENPYCYSGDHMKRISGFCIYLFDRILLENDFCWEDLMTLRFYFSTELELPMEMLSSKFTEGFNELAEITGRTEKGKAPLYNLIPVLGSGSSMDMSDIITCELFASKL